MAKSKKEKLSLEELLVQALVKEEDIPYEVPSNWIWTTINSISDFERGITFPASAKCHENGTNLIACIRTANIQENLEIDDLLYVNRSFMRNNENKLLRKNDILMSSANSRELVGKVSYVNELTDKMTFGGFVLNIRAKGIISKLLFYFIRLEFLSGRFIGESTQTTNIANINSTILGNYACQLPPFAEQQRIVDVIESLFKKLDRAKQLAQNALDSFGICKAAILHKAFTGELTAKWRETNKTNENNLLTEIMTYYTESEVKKNINNILEYQKSALEINNIENSIWYKCSIGAVGAVSNGSTPSRQNLDFWNGGIPWVSSGEVRNNIIEITKETISQLGYDNSSVKILPKGTVLIAMIGEGKTRGQSAIISINSTINQNIAAINFSHKKIEPKFMWYWLQKQYKSNREKGNGTGPQALNCQRVRELDFILPPLAEQKEIVRTLDNLLENEQRAKEICDVIEKIDLMKKAILARAFRGELGTNDPQEESAVGLLKEVLKEKM